MQSNFYVGISGQMAVERRVQSIANNVANMTTAGYRADGVTFDTVLSTTGDQAVAFSTGGSTYISPRAGDLIKTDNPLDVGVQGDAWLGVKTPTGIAYTRDGRMKINPSGELVSLNNNPILDAGGTGLILDPSAGAPTISADGMVTQNGKQVGAIGLFGIDANAHLTRASNSGVIPDTAATPILDFTATGMVQGFSEGSNINPVLELSKLIQIQRNLESMTQANQTADASLSDAIKTLGGAS